jgi:hypothetical protein
MQVLVATDAWDPQINGVVFSLKSLAGAARAHGVEVNFVTPSDFATLPLPTYPEIRLAAVTAAGFAKRIAHRKIDHIHVATEGPIGLAARSYCLSAGLIFTTSFHTRFPEYVRARFGVPESLTYAWLRRFHNAAGTTMVATKASWTSCADGAFSGSPCGRAASIPKSFGRESAARFHLHVRPSSMLDVLR